MIQTTLIRRCLTCDKVLRGRSDKKYCDDSCRNTYNNQLNAGGGNLVRNINNSLARNRRILESFLQNDEPTAKAHKERLIELNFNFKHVTHMHISKTGKIYYFCYDMGYLPMDNEWYLVVKTADL